MTNPGETEFGKLMVSEKTLDLLTGRIAEQLKISPEFMDYLGNRIAEKVTQALPKRQVERPFISGENGETLPTILLSGHKVLVPRINGFQPVAEKIQQFSKLEEASEDVATYRLTRLSLWKAAELGLSPDEVIEVLKIHGRTPPKKPRKK